MPCVLPHRHISLPDMMERFSSSILQKVYVSATSSFRALNNTTLLMAYQGELLDEMVNLNLFGHVQPSCLGTQLSANPAAAIHNCECARSLAVIGERA